MQAFEWHQGFTEGREYFEDDKHSGCPQTSCTAENIEDVYASAHKNRLHTKAHIVETVGICSAPLGRFVTGNIWSFLCDPQSKRASTTWKSSQSPRKQKFCHAK
ncbi:hypothetical protein TNCV_491571 [Trichonephila clavipes]|nr:hypothetical protein TNCV_491571 [Trichonephila clavipes]